MKKILIAALLFAVFTLFGCAKKVDIAAETSAVKTALDQITIAKEKGDMALYEQFVAPDSDIIVIGSDPEEFYVGWTVVKDSMKDLFNKANNIKMNKKYQAIKVDPSGDTAWFVERVDFSGTVGDKALMLSDVRYTGTLVKRDGKWLLVQSHASIPYVEVKKEECKECKVCKACKEKKDKETKNCAEHEKKK